MITFQISHEDWVNLKFGLDLSKVSFRVDPESPLVYVDLQWFSDSLTDIWKSNRHPLAKVLASLANRVAYVKLDYATK